MQFIANSLGVECDFCHVEGAFDKDDKDEKKTARKMMTMMITINQENFEGKKEVSCNTCHRGTPAPAGYSDDHRRSPRSACQYGSDGERTSRTRRADGLRADPVIDAYVKAVGGPDAIAKLKSATEKASMAMGPGKVSRSISTKRRPIAASLSRTCPVETTASPPTTEARAGSPFPEAPVRVMNADEQYAAKLDADFLVPSDPRKAFTELKSAKPDTIDGKEVNVVLGINPEPAAGETLL